MKLLDPRESMIYSSFHWISCVALLTIISTVYGRSALYGNFFEDSKESQEYLSDIRRNNLNQILDYIRDSSEFCPLVLSIISSESESSTVKFLSKYAAENTINLFKVHGSELSLKAVWKQRTDLTWIFFVDNIYELKALIYWQEDLWKSTNQYLILFTLNEKGISWIEIFQALWQRYNVYRVVVATAEDNFHCLTKYSPFHHSHEKFRGLCKVCFKETYNNGGVSINRRGENRSLDECEIVLRSDYNNKLFETFEDLRNHPLNIVVFPSLMMNISYDEKNQAKFSKLDAEVMSLLEQALKVKFNINVLSKFGSEDPFHNALKLIESGHAEMVLTGFFTKTYSNYKFEFTSAIYEDKLCFITPSSGLVPKSLMFFKPFRLEVWALLILYNIVITILWFFVKYLSTAFRKQQKISLPLMLDINSIQKTISRNSKNATKEEVQLSLRELRSSLVDDFEDCIPGFNRTVFITPVKKNVGFIADEPPEINPYVISCYDLVETTCYPLHGPATGAQKVFLLGTLFFALIVTGVYQSSLVSSLSKPFRYPELNTLEDILDSNMTIITKYWNLKDSLIDDSAMGSVLKDRIEIVQSELPTNQLVAYTKKVIALGRYASVKLENLTVYFDTDGNELLHIANECPATYMVSYVIRQYSPYKERITAILLRMHEAGLIDLWYRNMVYPFEVDEKKRKFVQSEKRIKLTLQHYSLTFLGLFIGLFTATMVFLGELYFASRLPCQVPTRNS